MCSAKPSCSATCNLKESLESCWTLALFQLPHRIQPNQHNLEHAFKFLEMCFKSVRPTRCRIPHGQTASENNPIRGSNGARIEGAVSEFTRNPYLYQVISQLRSIGNCQSTELISSSCLNLSVIVEICLRFPWRFQIREW
jgi:hypothetical protein